MTRIFQVVAEKEAAISGDIEFAFSDDPEHTLTAHPPGSGQVAMFMAQMGRHSSMSDKIAGAIDFFVSILDQADHDYVVRRLMDLDDPLGIEEVTDVMQGIMEDWTGRPTK